MRSHHTADLCIEILLEYTNLKEWDFVYYADEGKIQLLDQFHDYITDRKESPEHWGSG